MQQPSPPTPGLGVRRAALRLLDAVLRRGLPLEAEIAQATRDLSPIDRAQAIAIAGEVCRHLPDLDALIDSATRQPLAQDVKVRMVLRMALAQILILKTPAHAAIATALPLLERGPRRLAHGVLGNLVRAGATIPSPPNLPADVAARWGKAWGAEMLAGAAGAITSPPPLDLVIKTAADAPLWAERLGGTSLLAGHVRIPRTGDVTQLTGFADGAWWVQDLAAAIPARLLGAGAGRSVLDIGAAPGGKTMQLAAADWRVTALDPSERRLGMLRANLQRTALCAEIVQSSLAKYQGDTQFDAVLIDAPCSATGIFRRHPDVLHRVDARDIANRAAMQGDMLADAAGRVRAGGTLIYAVCSLEPAEGEEQIDRFLTNHGAWAIAPVDADELPDGIAPDARGHVRTLPQHCAAAGGIDGFFIARLVKN